MNIITKKLFMLLKCCSLITNSKGKMTNKFKIYFLFVKVVKFDKVKYTHSLTLVLNFKIIDIK